MSSSSSSSSSSASSFLRTGTNSRSYSSSGHKHQRDDDRIDEGEACKSHAGESFSKKARATGEFSGKVSVRTSGDIKHKTMAMRFLDVVLRRKCAKIPSAIVQRIGEFWRIFGDTPKYARYDVRATRVGTDWFGAMVFEEQWINYSTSRLVCLTTYRPDDQSDEDLKFGQTGVAEYTAPFSESDDLEPARALVPKFVLSEGLDMERKDLSVADYADFAREKHPHVCYSTTLLEERLPAELPEDAEFREHRNMIIGKTRKSRSSCGLTTESSFLFAERLRSTSGASVAGILYGKPFVCRVAVLEDSGLLWVPPRTFNNVEDRRVLWIAETFTNELWALVWTRWNGSDHSEMMTVYRLQGNTKGWVLGVAFRRHTHWGLSCISLLEEEDALVVSSHSEDGRPGTCTQSTVVYPLEDLRFSAIYRSSRQPMMAIENPF